MPVSRENRVEFRESDPKLYAGADPDHARPGRIAPDNNQHTHAANPLAALGVGSIFTKRPVA